MVSTGLTEAYIKGIVLAPRFLHGLTCLVRVTMSLETEHENLNAKQLVLNETSCEVRR